MDNSDIFKKIRIQCPICGKKGQIQVARKVIESSSRGVCAIEVTKNQLCSDSFIAYVDKNFVVRDYFIPDITLEGIEVVEKKVPTKEDELVIEEKKISDEDYNIVRSILQRKIFAYIIHAILLKKPIHLVYDIQDIYDQIVQVFEEITRNAFEMHITVGNMKEYKSNIKKYKDILVLDISSETILEGQNKRISQNLLIYEAEIVKKAFKQYDPTTSLIILKNEIQKIYSLVINLKNFLEEEADEGKKKWFKKNVIIELNRRFNIKITARYLNFILDIIQHHFGLNLSDYIIDATDGIKNFFSKL